jgi:hypothetical protein
MTLMLAPRSHNAFSKFWLPIEHSIVGHPGSFFLTGDVLRMAALHSSVSLITSIEGRGLLLLRMSRIYFAYVGTWMASYNGILIYNF